MKADLASDEAAFENKRGICFVVSGKSRTFAPNFEISALIYRQNGKNEGCHRG